MGDVLVGVKQRGKPSARCGRIHYRELVKALLGSAIWAGMMPLTAWCADRPLPSALPGHWANTESNDTVGLILNPDKSCELYTSRLTAPKASRACKYEFYADKTYFIYLKGADGLCGTEADFEFRYYEDLSRIDLQVGDGNQFLLEKKPAGNPAGNKGP